MLFTLPEIEADFLAIYRKEVQVMDRYQRDTAGLSGPRFLNLCEQLPHYKGAVQGKAIRWKQQDAEHDAEPIAQLMLDEDLEVGRA